MMDLEQAQSRAARLAAALVRWSRGELPADLAPALTAEGRIVLDAIQWHEREAGQRARRASWRAA